MVVSTAHESELSLPESERISPVAVARFVKIVVIFPVAVARLV